MARRFEAHELRDAKAAVNDRLSAIKLSAYQLTKVDKRLHDYCKSVIKYPLRHNLWEQLSVERFLAMCRKYGIRVGIVKAFFKFYESLTFRGSGGPTHFKLTPVQCFQFASIYGFWDGNKRVVREAVLFVPRKFSKTTSSAAFALWDLIFGDANAQSFVGANSADQAKNCFEVIQNCVRALDPAGRRFIVNQEIIKTIGMNRTAKSQCLTASAKTKDGLNASVVIMDEFSQARDANLLSVLTTSMGARQNPLTVIITTASDVYDGPFFDMLAGYKMLLMGEYEDDTVFAHLFEPDVDDREDDPATWAKVHPHLGVTVEPDFYALEYRAAKRNGPDAMMAFRTKLLNRYAISQRRVWISRDLAMRCTRPMDLLTVRPGCIAMIGIDLAEVNDFAAMTTAILDPSDQHVDMITDYFFPAGALADHPNEALYRKWASDGHLHLIDADAIDYAAIVNRVVEVSQSVNIKGIGYDAHGAIDMGNYLRAYGLGNLLFAIPQGHGYFDGPVKALEKAMRDGRLFINDNPINHFCFANAVLEENSDGFKPMKRSGNMKIDGVIAMLMALRQLLYWKR